MLLGRLTHLNASGFHTLSCARYRSWECRCALQVGGSENALTGLLIGRSLALLHAAEHAEHVPDPVERRSAMRSHWSEDCVVQQGLAESRQGAFARADISGEQIWNHTPPADWFAGIRTEENFGGDVGFLAGPKLKPDELERVRKILHRRLTYNAYNLHGSQAAELIESAPLHQYHTVCDGVDHSKMLTKTGRILPKSDVEEMLQMSIFDTFREAVGDFSLSDEDNIGHQQITMRATRPNMLQDVGFPHRDSWFWDYYSWPVPEGKNRTKVWMGVEVNAAQNGLSLAPGSHKRDYDFEAENLGTKIKFTPKFDIDAVEFVNFPGDEGETVAFNYGTLHVGRMNTAEKTRVSIEFTLLY